MTLPSRFDFPLAKAQYLFSRATGLGVGGDKRKFWQEVMGFTSPEAIQEAILAKISLELLEPAGQNEYGDRYRAIILIEGSSGISWLIRTAWIVLSDEDVARFVTAVPERKGRQS